jgi:hypothetical protein
LKLIAGLLGAALLTSPVLSQANQTNPSPQLPKPEVLLSEIEASGPKPVLSRLWADEPQFEALCGRIETGEPSWLEVARRLKPASDAAVSLSLNYSVARALPVAPARVLGLVDRGFSVSDVCTSPFIEPEPGVAERYEARALQALATLAGTRLGPLAEQCAERVRLPGR